jgi:hypothetical protein
VLIRLTLAATDLWIVKKQQRKTGREAVVEHEDWDAEAVISDDDNSVDDAFANDHGRVEEEPPPRKRAKILRKR